MLDRMKRLLPLLLLAGCGQQVAGTYVVNIETAPGSTCQSCPGLGGDTLTVSERDGQTYVAEPNTAPWPAQVDGDQVSWTVNQTASGCLVTSTWKATVDGGKMTGSGQYQLNCGTQTCTCKYDIKG